jgi:hypothetical protein
VVGVVGAVVAGGWVRGAGEGVGRESLGERRRAGGAVPLLAGRALLRQRMASVQKRSFVMHARTRAARARAQMLTVDALLCGHMRASTQTHTARLSSPLPVCARYVDGRGDSGGAWVATGSIPGFHLGAGVGGRFDSEGGREDEIVKSVFPLAGSRASVTQTTLSWTSWRRPCRSRATVT